jgi:hypothetical protein
MSLSDSLVRVSQDAIPENLGFVESDRVPFPEALFALLLNESPSVISWISGGQAFKILDAEKFETEVMPRYFIESNLATFLQQLRSYGFHTDREASETSYAHPMFQAGKPELVTGIRRSGVKSRDSADGLLPPGSADEFNGRYWQISCDRPKRTSTRSAIVSALSDKLSDDSENGSSDSDNSSSVIGQRGFVDDSTLATSYFCASYYDQSQSQVANPEAAGIFSNELDTVITCQLCEKKKYQVLIPCGHSFCSDCVTKNASSKSNSRRQISMLNSFADTKRLQFVCPTCTAAQPLKECLAVPNKMVNDIYDTVMNVKSPCPKHCFMEMSCSCMFCDVQNICPVW